MADYWCSMIDLWACPPLPLVVAIFVLIMERLNLCEVLRVWNGRKLRVSASKALNFFAVNAITLWRFIWRQFQIFLTLCSINNCKPWIQIRYPWAVFLEANICRSQIGWIIRWHFCVLSLRFQLVNAFCGILMQTGDFYCLILRRLWITLDVA
jgi:hypothetical protein